MMRSLWIAKTGMDAQQTNLDVISNNLSNVSTNGFKRSRAVFEDLLYQTLRQPGAQTTEQTQVPSGLQVGTGVRPVSTVRNFAQGNLQQTSNQMDLAINGQGFFQIQMPDGTTSYTRDGSFQLDSAGTVVTSNGYPILGPVTVPAGTQNISVGQDGTVSATVAGQVQPQQLGQFQLANFVNPAGLFGTEHVPRNGGLRSAHASGSRHEWRRFDFTRVCGNLQRECGGRTGGIDSSATCLRNQFQSHLHIRPDVAAFITALI
jgi:flagellar basal-body rod protein FlgG